MTTFDTPPPVVVVGLCAHGLAMVRALGKQGLNVYALEANPTLPGYVTRYAKVVQIKDINGFGLIETLLQLRKTFSTESSPVLLLTNDNMVKQVAENYWRLKDLYQISWSTDCANVIGLLRKSEIAAYCERKGFRYPRTTIISALDSCRHVQDQLNFPVIVKPDRPLSSFKVTVVHTLEELEGVVGAQAHNLPLIVQQWIPGDDTSIFFCAFYLDHGRPIAHFGGRKLRSRPMGHTTVAEACQDPDVYETAVRFFSNTEISGPVSLELKRDPDGKLWIIEPTVGRTDFWLGCCIANGFDLPCFEYCHQVGAALPKRPLSNRYVWLNLDRDPLGLLWYVWRCLISLKRPARPVFLYWDMCDFRPFIRGLVRSSTNFVGRVKSRIRRLAVHGAAAYLLVQSIASSQECVACKLFLLSLEFSCGVFA
jgi:D-aspartate ligase